MIVSLISFAWIFWDIRIVQGVMWNLLHCLWNILYNSLAWLFWGIRRLKALCGLSFISFGILFATPNRSLVNDFVTRIEFTLTLNQLQAAHLNSRRRNPRPRLSASDAQAPGTLYRDRAVEWGESFASTAPDWQMKVWCRVYVHAERNLENDEVCDYWKKFID